MWWVNDSIKAIITALYLIHRRRIWVKLWPTKDEIETSIRTFQGVRDETESTFLKNEWRGDENGRENLVYMYYIESIGFKSFCV